MLYLNGLLSVGATIEFPYRGEWHATIEVGETDSLAGSVSITTDAGDSLAGRIVRGEATDTANRYYIAGCSVDLDATPASRAWQTPTVAIVLAGIVGSGRYLPSVYDARTLSSWALRGHSRRAALTQLAEAIGARWYVTDLGQVALAGTTSTVSTLVDAEVLSDDRDAGEISVRANSLALRPAMIHAGFDVRSVRYTIGASFDCIAETISASDRIRDAITRVARSSLSTLPYAVAVRGKVLSATEDILSVLLTDGTKIDVPPSYGLPGARAVSKAGSVVWVSWDEGDPQKPRVQSYEGDCESITLAGGSVGAGRVGDSVDCGVLLISSTGTVTGYLSGAVDAATRATAKAAAVAGGGGGFDIRGKISSGSSKVKVG